MVSTNILLLAVAISCFTFPLVSCQRCFQQIDFNYFSCEQTCTPSDSSLPLIERCNNLVRFGCQLNTCEGGYECTGTADKEILACANGRVRFPDASPANATFNFRIDLNTPPLAGDYYFLINSRLRIEKFLPAIKQSVMDFVKSVNGSSNVRFGVGIYLNENMLDMGYRNLVSLTSDHDAVQSVVNSITVRNARGGPDALLQALVRAATQPFRPEARKIIFLLGETPGHEPSKVGDAEPLTRVIVTKTLQDAGISYVAVNYRNSGLEAATQSFGVTPVVQTEGKQSSFIAERTGGVVVWRSNSVFDAFWRAKASINRQFDLDEFTCRDFIDIAPGGTTFPVTIRKRASAVVPLTLTFRNGMCVPFTCQYRIMENSIELERFTIEVPRSKDTIGC